MKNPFFGLFRARDKPQDSVSAAPTFYFGTSGSGKLGCSRHFEHRVFTGVFMGVHGEKVFMTCLPGI